MGLFDSSTMIAMETGLNASSQRQLLISDNVANIDTPHYRRKDISFKALVTRKIQDEMPMSGQCCTHKGHIDFQSPASNLKRNFKVEYPNETRINEFGNNVHIDLEMGNMNLNNTYYNTVSTLISKKFTTLNSVIKGAR